MNNTTPINIQDSNQNPQKNHYESMVFGLEDIDYRNDSDVEFGWYKSGTSLILNLGVMKKAAVIRKNWRDGKYYIGESGFFYFQKDVYDLRFNNKKDAVAKASFYICRWVEKFANAFVTKTNQQKK